ncbi:MAG: DVU0772 family protein [Candidatus Electrothrix sp. GW3-4]|uniref:DVU0772 family protein n=1 Tax=Candidatus Electrothrix sp. GW3-4 TaxID=3126740 RepID=UPI0030D3090E
MLNLAELRKNRILVNSIDWAMTPEKAVEMYLEWGTGWIRGNDFVSSSDDESYYFVIYDWETEPPQVTLVHRTLGGAEELAKIEVPKELFDAACQEDGRRPGGTVHRLNRGLQEWLNTRLKGPPIEFFNIEQ